MSDFKCLIHPIYCQLQMTGNRIFGYRLKRENALWTLSTTLYYTKLKTTTAYFGFLNISLAEIWSHFPSAFVYEIFARFCCGGNFGGNRKVVPTPFRQIDVTNEGRSAPMAPPAGGGLKQPRLVKWSGRKDKVKLTDTLIETSDPFKPCGRLQTSRHL